MHVRFLALALAIYAGGCAGEHLPPVVLATSGSQAAGVTGTVHVVWRCPSLPVKPIGDNRISMLIDEREVLKISQCNHAKISVVPGQHPMRMRADANFDLAKITAFRGQPFTVMPSNTLFLTVRGHNPPLLYEINASAAQGEIAAIDRERSQKVR